MAALRFWLRLGFISFGGPAGQIAIMHEALVDKKRWISERRFLHALNFCMVLPGPEALQLSIYMGWLLHRTPGAIVAGILFVLPSLILLIVLSWIYIAYGHHPVIAGVFYGVKPAVTAIVFQAMHRIGQRTLNNGLLWTIAILAFVAIFFLSIPFPAIIIAAALLGIVGSRYAPDAFDRSTPGKTPTAHKLPAMIDDDTPTPLHAHFYWNRAVRILIGGLLLWTIPITLLVMHFGWHEIHTEMSLFFSKAAMLTFGGAYAVLPYVYQGAVTHYGWLTAAQMIDGLALGETTPGPLIMVVAFVGFVGAYLNDAATGMSPLASGILAAVLVSWFTFLPSFIFVLLGGPLVESTHGNLRLTAPLTAISAAVVGVILNLALFFAYHTLWPSGFADGMDLISFAITAISLVALFRLKIGVLPLIGLAGITGYLAQWVLG